MLIKIWSKIIEIMYRLILLTTFLGILPLIIYIYYNVYISNVVNVGLGSVAVLTMTYLNYKIQGGK